MWHSAVKKITLSGMAVIRDSHAPTDAQYHRIVSTESETSVPNGYIIRIPSAKAGKEKIKVCFAYDLNGILKVSDEIVSNGKSATIEINTSAAGGGKLDVSEWTSSPYSKK